ncbi:PEP-CTERM sorting domain-containing protein [Rubellicoccus peritrichatus]|uniref:PEP-CTERM sorting domain-containing protein n=1 Tax=Rubellicoccus peritrichatus TaxID=3080537 RepID=A0AAQ3L757_9BACT|nr:PEP-CTERM sorting domain-containing protein [Puniceicoccus sp. CR14]WOO40829.1 PEP-CTERM sorting domain-containing protein [Puniceicoccus sp. CR14]
MKTVFLAAVMAASLMPSIAHAAVTVTISGGSGSPLSITTTEDITFTGVTPGLTGYGFFLADAAAGNTILSSSNHTGTMDWNSTGNISGIGGMGTFPLGFIQVTDLFIFWSETGGNQPVSTATMTLTAGTRTSTANVNSNVINGTASYEIFMYATSIEGNAGTQVPEPSTYAALGGLAMLAFTLYFRYKNIA